MSEQIECVACREPFDRVARMGPTPRYCSNACRTSAYRQRLRVVNLGDIPDYSVAVAEGQFGYVSGVREVVFVCTDGWHPVGEEGYWFEDDHEFFRYCPNARIVRPAGLIIRTHTETKK